MAAKQGARVSAIPQKLVDIASGMLGFFRAGASAGRMLERDGPQAGLPQAPRVEPDVSAPGERPAPQGPSTTEVIPSRSSAMGVPQKREPWFGPGTAIQPAAPREDVAGRAFDYPTAVNQVTQPRRTEQVDFATLRALADQWDLLRICLETRKDQVSKLGWSILPKKPPGALFRPKADDRCRRVEKFFRKPDGVNFWDQWIRLVMEDQLVLDAVSLYKRQDNAGRPYSLEVVDGATIMPLLDRTGRRPLPPNPAYQQVLKGMPAIEYTSRELYYCPRNPRPHKIYGFSPVEQILATINIGLRREHAQLQHYTAGNVPEALIGVPETWSVPQIAEFQRYWDNEMEDVTKRRRARFVPSNIAFQPTRNDGGLIDQFDEWLARIVCYTLSLPPLPFVKQFNRATAQTAQDTALEEGLGPQMVWLKNIVDHAIADFHGEPDLELVWDDVRKLDPSEQLGADLQRIQRGIISIDDVRASMGQEAFGLPAIVFGVGPQGWISVPALKKAIDDGLDVIQPPMAPGMGMLGPDGMPMGGMGPEGMPAGEDPLAGAPPGLMAAAGAPDNGEEGEDPEAEGFDDFGGEEAWGEPGEPGGEAQRLPPLRVVPPSPADLQAANSGRVDPDVARGIQFHAQRLGISRR